MNSSWQQPALDALFIKYDEYQIPIGMMRWVDILSELDELEWPRNGRDFSYLMWSLNAEPVAYDYEPLPC